MAAVRAVMESYKHSCPFCGQHIEYTAGYCGKQLTCPICGKTVTFPAVPPGGKGKGLRINRPEPVRVKWSMNPRDIIACLNQFKHWSIVLYCVVPFVLLVALLVGASVLKKKFGDAPAMPDAPEVHADANAWQKMTDLAKADGVVQERVVAVVQARAVVAAAQRTVDNLHAYYHGKTLDPVTYKSYENQRKADDQVLDKAQRGLSAARDSFERALQKYQQLGGTVDYRRQLPQ